MMPADGLTNASAEADALRQHGLIARDSRPRRAPARIDLAADMRQRLAFPPASTDPGDAPRILRGARAG